MLLVNLSFVEVLGVATGSDYVPGIVPFTLHTLYSFVTQNPIKWLLSSLSLFYR